ncbi:MAG: polyprenyl diphosphate synthase [Clostridia bacterium]
MRKELNHIAIIMDGNGRWAKERSRPRYYGHQKGAENILTISKILNDMGIKYLTLYAFSTENWSRPKREVDYLTKELPFIIYNRFKSHLEKRNMRFFVSGKSEGIPQKTLDLLRELEETSKDNEGLEVVFAYNYGGKAEILDAVNSLLGQDLKEIDEETLRSEFYAPHVPDVDLLIRPGGEKRLSNFLLWQTAYSEIYFCDTYWPDFNEQELKKAIEFYNNRNRRFGSINYEKQSN